VTSTDETGGVSIIRPESGVVKKRDMDQNHPQRRKERGGEVSNGRATTDGGKEMTGGTV
jgi:hypothetical protein